MNKKFNTIRSLSEKIRKNLTELYPENEIEQFIYLIFNHLLNYSKIDIHLKAQDTVSDGIIQQIDSIIMQLKDFQPIQYIFGETEFYGLKFFLDQHVLIPRQETEELVQWVINDSKDMDLKLLDIGTGSGCIAVTLARFITNSVIDAMDVSAEALEIAKKNACANNVRVRYFNYDILGDEVFPWSVLYDSIVSNPPYVRQSEKHLAGRNVIGFEPHDAIFVSDGDPFIFYRAIAKFGKRHLKKNGCVYLEINEALGADIKALLSDSGYDDIVLKKDINNKDRMIRAKLL
jgi:release factor glutamine methyltransferase